MRAKVQVIEGNALILLPNGILSKAGWMIGQEVRISVHGDAVILSPATPQHSNPELERLAALVHEDALELFEGDSSAKDRWMVSPLPILHGRTPHEMLNKAADIESLRLIIKRLDHGSFP